MAVEEAKTNGAINQIISENYIESKYSDNISSNELNEVLNGEEPANNTTNLENKHGYFNQSFNMITKHAFEIIKSSENSISSSTNVITATDKGNIEITPSRETVLDNLLRSSIDTSIKPNEIQSNHLNNNNFSISNQENNVLVENELESKDKKMLVDNNTEMYNCEQDITEKQAYKDLINEIESEKSTVSSNTTENYPIMTENSSNITEKAATPKSMQVNDDSLTNNNNDYDKSLDAKNLSNKDDIQQKSNTEDSAEITDGSAETAEDLAVDIKCEVDCNALLDDIKDEIFDDDDYTVPENFMDLANHFMTNEARVVLQRVVVYKCPQCPRVFTSSGQRTLHKAKHVSEQVQSQRRNYESSDERFTKRHQCPDCDLRFVQESTLETHMVIHRPYPNICDCGIGYTKLTDLEQHEKLVHNKIKTESTYTSTWKPIINLKKTKRSEINRKRIKRQPEVPEPLPEPTISRYGRTQKRLVNIREKSPILEYSSDDLDDETLFQPKKKKAKVKVQTPEQIRAEEARLIEKEKKALEKAQNKEKRLAIKQETKGPFICSICDKELSCYRNYETHLLIHSNLRNYKCELCDKRFNSAVGLRNHHQTHLENKFKCSFCDKTFNNKSNRQNHENIHMGLKLYACGYCDKSFTDRSAFNRHERIHTGVKPYKCEFCPKAFSDASAAIVHRRRHKGERKYACRICEKTYIDKGGRELHEKLHLKDYAFECDICSAKFQLKQYLVVHMQRVHMPRQKIKCSVCEKKVYAVNMARHKFDVHGIKFKRLKRFDFKAPLEIEIDTTKEF